MKIRVPIFWRFLIVMSVFLILPIGVFTFLMQNSLQKDFQDRIKTLLQSSMSGYDAIVRAELLRVEQDAFRLISTSAFIEYIETRRGQKSKTLFDTTFPSVFNEYFVSIYDYNGEAVFPGDKPFWTADLGALTKDGGARNSAKINAEGIGLEILRPLRANDGSSIYMLVQYRLHPSLLEGIRSTYNMVVTFYDTVSTWSVVSNQVWANGMLRSKPISKSPLIEAYVSSKGKLNFSEQFLAGERVFAGVQESTAGFSNPTLLVMTMPVAEIRAFDASLYLLILAMITTFLAVITSYVLLRRVVRPLTYLSSEINRLRYKIRNGEAIPNLSLGSNDEINDVAHTFNSLVRDLLDSRQKIEEQRTQIVSYAQNLEERVLHRTHELEDAKIRAEVANAQKSRFLMNMNHELRTPLNSISGINELLRFGAYDKTSEWAVLFGAMAQTLLERYSADYASIATFITALADELRACENPKRALMTVFTESFPNLRDDPELNEKLIEMANLLEEEARSTEYAYETIHDAGESLLHIINEVINLSRIESGVIEVHRESVRLAEIIHSCMAHAHAYLGVKNKVHVLDLNLSMDLRVPEWVYVDGQKIKQVLLNYLTNAIKYTDAGLIVVSVTMEDTGSVPFVRISVKDTGRGIDEKDKTLLFMEFSRAFEVREIEGTGLGLALSRKLIERMGGEVGVDSVLGSGSNFWFTVPLVQDAQALEAVGADSVLKKGE